MKLILFLGCLVPAIAFSQTVLINEVVTGPQQDWSSIGFSGSAPGGTAGADDEWIEIYIGTDGLNLTGWTIELLDGTDVIGDLTATGAFDVSNYFSVAGGSFTDTRIGDYLVLGNVNSSDEMNNSITINLRDNTAALIDEIIIGTGGTVFTGLSSGITSESICRIPNGTDTNNDVTDFVKTQATLGTNNSPSGTILINEVVTDPQQDWSTTNFNGTISAGTVSDVDEWVELYIGTSGLNLTKWIIELNDGTTFLGDLTASGAFQNSVYFGSGSFTNTQVGDYIVLGDPSGSNNSLDHVFITLKHPDGTIVDDVEIGENDEGDATNDGAPNGLATGAYNESVGRYVNALDSDDDSADFRKGQASLGSANIPYGLVLINEVITDPEQDWSTNSFNGTVGAGAIDSDDEWIEIYIGATGLDLTGWTIELNDAVPVTGDLTNSGAFQVSNYVSTGGGGFTDTRSGDYIVLGNVNGGDNDDVITVVLKDNLGNTIDQVVIDTSSGTMFSGLATGTNDESVCRIPNGQDTNVETADFVQTRASLGTNNSPTGVVLINEVITDPQQNWSTNGFDGTVVAGTIDQADEWIELYIGTAGLNLTKWTILMDDATNESGALTTTGAFGTVNYVTSGSGSFINTEVGDYLILGNPTGSMDNEIYLVLRDAYGDVVDEVEIGDDPEGDGAGDGAPSGGATIVVTGVSDESISRISTGLDTDNDINDFEQKAASLGAENGLTTVYVDDNAVDDTGAGTIGDPKMTIQAGYNLTAIGGRLIVAEGTYAESVTINKSISIEGPNITIPANGTRNPEAIINPGSFASGFTVNADNVTIDGFQFGVSNESSNITVAISSDASDALDFSNNIIFANAAGISINDASSGAMVVEDNNIELLDLSFAGNASVGIALQSVTGTADADITNNDITGASWGILGYGLSASPQVVIDGGTYSGCTQGISVYNTNSTFTEFSPSTYTIQNVTMSGFVDTGAGLTQPDAEAGIYAFVSGAGADADDLNITIDNVDISGVENIRSDFAGIYIADFADDDNAIDVIIKNSYIHDNQNRGIFIRGQNATATINTSRIEGNGFNPTASGGNPGFSVIARNGSITNVSNCFIINPASLSGVEDIGNNYYVSGLHMSAAGTLVVSDCSLDDNGNGFIAQTSGLDLSRNYFGSTDESTILSLVGASNDFTPWIDSSRDTDLVTDGFQPDRSVVHVGLSGTQTGSSDRIQEAHDLLAAGDTIIVEAGTYPETLTATKELVLQPVSGVSLNTIGINAAVGDELTIDGDILINTAVTLGINGIINSAGTMTLGSGIADLPPESATAYVAGNVSSGARVVGTGALTSILGVAISDDPLLNDNLGNVTIVRSSGAGATVGTLPDGPPDNRSIDIRWDITPDNDPVVNGRDVTFSWYNVFDNGNDLSNLVVFRSTGGGVWDQQAGSFDITPISDNVLREVTETGVTGFSVWTVAEAGEALPVELISFSASPEDNGRVLLSWETATEINNDRFEIECSADGKTFQQKGVVQGNGNTSERIAYTFLDHAPMSGINYYRLKQVDYDGAFEYSKIIWINPFESSEILVYPNPAYDVLKIVGNGLLTEKNEVRVLNIEGREMMTMRPSMNEQELTLDLKNYPVGIYIIEISSPDKLYRYKFMKD